MEPEHENTDYEPISKRFRFDPDTEDAATTSQVPDERYQTSEADHSTSPVNVQGGEVDHETDDSIDGIDNLSGISSLSELNDQYDERSWQPAAGPISWVQRQMSLGKNPRSLLHNFLGDEYEISTDVDEWKLWNLIVSLVMEPRPRKKLADINTLDDVVGLMKKCNKIVVLTGAGVSVSCGIPDFRSRDGVYARLAKDFPNLPDPQAMFDIEFFKTDQRPFFKFAKEIYPGQFEPSLCHKFIKLLETQGKLLRNYSQNIDTLEKVAGIEHVIECHGSFATATCQVCGHSVDSEAIREDIFNQCIPRCPVCGPQVEEAVMKPDIVFFGESLPETFHKQMASDKNECDLLIVIGSSLKVRPVALIPSAIPATVPQIIINREPLHKHLNFDVELLGNCDDIVSELCKRLGEGWDHLAQPGPLAEEVEYSKLPPVCPSASVVDEDVKVREDLVDHSADSGLGDFDGASSAKESGSATGTYRLPNSGSGGQSSSSVCLDASNTDRFERLSSSDSGMESGSGTTPDVHRPADHGGGSHSQSHAASSLDSCDHVSSTSSDPKQDCSCRKEQKKDETGLAPDSFQGMELSKNSAESAHHPSTSHHKRSRSLSETCHSSQVHSTNTEHSSRKRTHSHSHSHGEQEKIDIERESRKDNSHCSHTDTLEEMRQMWVPRRRLSISSRSQDNQVIFVPPNRYIFRGAEVYSSSEDSSDAESLDGNSIAGDSLDSTPPGSVSPPPDMSKLPEAYELLTSNPPQNDSKFHAPGHLNSNGGDNEASFTPEGSLQ